MAHEGSPGDRSGAPGGPWSGAAIRLLRAFRLRCPRCGSPGMLRHWLRPVHRCPACGLRTDRGEEDFFLGAMLLNFVATELAATAAVAAVAAWTWPTVPWDLLLPLGLVLVVVAPVAGYPFSRLVWLAIDLTMRPGDESGRGGER